jgi:hypothetical protein
MAREDALVDLEKLPYDEETIAQDFEYIATKLEIPVAELRGYMDMPCKSYKDYRNQEGLFRVGAWVLHSLGVERRAKKR